MRLLLIALTLFSVHAFAKEDCESAVRGEVIAFPTKPKPEAAPAPKKRQVQVLDLMNHFDNFATMDADLLYDWSEEQLVRDLHGFADAEEYLREYFTINGFPELVDDLDNAVQRLEVSPAFARLRDLSEHYQLSRAWNQFEHLEHVLREGRQPPADELLPELEKMILLLSELRTRLETRGEGHANEFLNAFEGWMNRSSSIGRYLQDESEISAHLNRMMVITAHLQTNAHLLRRRRANP